MAEKPKDMWLKVLISVLVSLILLSFGFTTTKADKETLNRHEINQKIQFDDIKVSLKLILEETIKRQKNE